MSRLTLPHYGGKGHYMKCSERLACNGNCGDCDSLDEIVEKLAEYEDKEEQKPQTNADRIRAMSDEELVEHFMIGSICHYISKVEGMEWCATHGTCEQCVRDWLRQPVKDGEGDG